MFAVWCVVAAVCYSLVVVRCLFVTDCLLFVVCSLFVVRCVVFVVRRLLRVLSCVLDTVY